MKVVCANTLAQARVLTSLEQLDVIGRSFPPDQYKALEHLALGASVEQTWQEVVMPALADAASQEPVDTTDLRDRHRAHLHPDRRRRGRRRTARYASGRHDTLIGYSSGPRVHAAETEEAELRGHHAHMHTFKGLEYRYTAVVGVNDRALPNPSAITPEEVDRLHHEADLAAERCLLFVACTRARDSLYVSWAGSRARSWWMQAAGHGSGHSLLTLTEASKRKHLQAVSRYFHFHGKV